MQKVKTKQTDKAEKTTMVDKKPVEKTARKKVEFTGTMESMLEVLSTINGEAVTKAETDVFNGIHKAGKKLGIETGNIVAGCGGVAINDIMKRIVEVNNG